MKSKFTYLLIAFAPMSLFVIVHYLFSVAVTDISIYFGVVAVFSAGVVVGRTNFTKGEQIWMVGSGKRIPFSMLFYALFATSYIVMVAFSQSVVEVNLTGTAFIFFICVTVVGCIFPSLIKQIPDENYVKR